MALLPHQPDRTPQRAPSRGQLPGGPVTALAKAAHGDGIWLGTGTGTVAHWDGSKWQLVTTLDAGIQTMLDAGG